MTDQADRLQAVRRAFECTTKNGGDDYQWPSSLFYAHAFIAMSDADAAWREKHGTPAADAQREATREWTAERARFKTLAGLITMAKAKGLGDITLHQHELGKFQAWFAAGTGFASELFAEPMNAIEDGIRRNYAEPIPDFLAKPCAPPTQPPSAPEGDLYWQIVEQLSMVHDATIRGEDNKIAERANLLMEKIAAHRPSAPEGDVERVARKIYDLLVLHHGTSYSKVAEYIAHAMSSPAPQQARSEDNEELGRLLSEKATAWAINIGSYGEGDIGISFGELGPKGRGPTLFAALQSALAAKP